MTHHLVIGRIVLFALLALSCPAATAVAHDSWLIVNRNVASERDVIWAAFVTGEIFPHGDAATDPERVDSFFDLFGDRRINIENYRTEDKTLAARFTPRGAGVHVLAVALKPKLIEMDAEAFERYLREERADRAVAMWLQKSPRPRTTVERYTKLGKTIVEISGAEGGPLAFQTPVGHRLEIIPLTNPTAWSVGETVAVEVLLDGHPWADVPVSAGHEGLEKHGYVAQTRTDDQGRASIKLTRPGHWFIKAHLIRPVSGLAGWEWESFWASLTFRAGGTVQTSEVVTAVEALHGRKDPWAVIGYRIAESAMAKLGLAKGSDDIQASVYLPVERPYVALVDGVQAASGTTIGRTTLRVERVKPEETRVVFRNRATGQELDGVIDPDSFKHLVALRPEAMEEAAYKIAAAPIVQLVKWKSPPTDVLPTEDLPTSRPAP